MHTRHRGQTSLTGLPREGRGGSATVTVPGTRAVREGPGGTATVNMAATRATRGPRVVDRRPGTTGLGRPARGVRQRSDASLLIARAVRLRAGSGGRSGPRGARHPGRPSAWGHRRAESRAQDRRGERQLVIAPAAAALGRLAPRSRRVSGAVVGGWVGQRGPAMGRVGRIADPQPLPPIRVGVGCDGPPMPVPAPLRPVAPRVPMRRPRAVGPGVPVRLRPAGPGGPTGRRVPGAARDLAGEVPVRVAGVRLEAGRRRAGEGIRPGTTPRDHGQRPEAVEPARAVLVLAVAGRSAGAAGTPRTPVGHARRRRRVRRGRVGRTGLGPNASSLPRTRGVRRRLRRCRTTSQLRTWTGRPAAACAR